ncbi:hypothetical protein Tco_0302279, partial [Tanacetum coccineum]
YVPAGSRNSSVSVTAGGSHPAASRNRPTVNSAGRPNPTGRVRQAAHLAAAQSNPAGWPKRPASVSTGTSVSAGWLNPAARPYFRPSSVTLGEIKDHIFGGPRVMVDLINLHGYTINDPQGRLKSELAWVSQVH